MIHVSISPEVLFHIGPLAVTNSILTTWVSIIVLIILVKLADNKFKLATQNTTATVWEMIIEFFIDLCKSIAGEKKGQQFFPLVTTLFLFILTMNWLGLVPGVGTIGLKHEETSVVHAADKNHENNEKVDSNTKQIENQYITSDDEHDPEKKHSSFTPILRAGTADLNMTLALAIVAMVAVQFYAIKHIGLKNHLHKFFNFSGPIQFFVGILELVSEFAKVISFAFRLFGNIFAGEVLLVVIMALVPLILPAAFIGMEIFVGLIQAFVFAMLTLVFLALATEKHSH